MNKAASTGHAEAYRRYFLLMDAWKKNIEITPSGFIVVDEKTRKPRLGIEPRWYIVFLAPKGSIHADIYEAPVFVLTCTATEIMAAWDRLAACFDSEKHSLLGVYLLDVNSWDGDADRYLAAYAPDRATLDEFFETDVSRDQAEILSTGPTPPRLDETKVKAVWADQLASFGSDALTWVDLGW